MVFVFRRARRRLYGPGGGFQAGVIFAAGFILYGLVFGTEALRSAVPPHILRIFIALGLVLYAGVGVATLLLEADFLAYNALSGIKEFCPQDIVYRHSDGSLSPNTALAESSFRHGLERFKSEAERMSKIRHSNLIGVNEYFEANNTLYMVMNHEEGRDLRWFISKMGGNLDWDLLQRVFPPIGNGLQQMHQLGIVHLDVKPANVLLPRESRPRTPDEKYRLHQILFRVQYKLLRQL